MSYKIDDLQLRDGTKVFPNILKENIPNGAIDANKLASDLVNLINAKANASDVYTKNEIDTKFLQYYTKAQVEGLLPDMTRYYTKTEVDEYFYNKVQINNNYYTKTEVNSLIPSLSNYYDKQEVDGLLTNYYTKTEVQDLLTDTRYLIYNLTKIYTLQGTSGYLTTEQLTDITTNENAIIKVLLNYGVNNDPTFFRRDYEDVDSTDIIFRHVAGYDPTMVEYNNLYIDKTTGQWYVQGGQILIQPPLSTTNVPSGTLNEAIGFNANGDVVRGSVGGSAYLHNVVLKCTTDNITFYFSIDVVNNSSTKFNDTSLRNYIGTNTTKYLNIHDVGQPGTTPTNMDYIAIMTALNRSNINIVKLTPSYDAQSGTITFNRTFTNVPWYIESEEVRPL